MQSAAFAAGELSFDKVRQATTVVTPATDELVTTLARGASGSQLARICRSLRQMLENEPARAARRGLWSRVEEDAMLRLVALLPPEEGEIVMKAIASIAATSPLPDGVEEPVAARRSDALVAMSENVLAGGAPGLVVAGAAPQMVVHVDVGVLTGESPEGACNLENGVRLSQTSRDASDAKRTLIAVIEREGLPIDVGRSRRISTTCCCSAGSITAASTKLRTGSRRSATTSGSRRMTVT